MRRLRQQALSVPAILRRLKQGATLVPVDEETGIYREEVILLLNVLADIRHDTSRIADYLLDEDDGTEEEEDA